jgi:hypothetical protein
MMRSIDGQDVLVAGCPGKRFKGVQPYLKAVATVQTVRLLFDRFER